ncbi:regulator of chromosome condensation 1/beta-lactamase-inhibitor protein II [Aspergillus granulosus]|uniref:Regulator of chromosome condensation 1/beta-lactamase-inhibitor protein II n=1 Tax=Aspergillus granulosus TaxID=176169 RepID=A0ABR4HCI0_9EURO
MTSGCTETSTSNATHFVTGEEATSGAPQDFPEGKDHKEDSDRDQQHPNPHLNQNHLSNFVTEGDQLSEQPTEEATSQEDDQERLEQQFPNPHLNPNYPFDLNEPSDFVARDQATNEAIEVAVSPVPDVSWREQTQNRQGGELLSNHNPNNASNAGEIPKFVVGVKPPSTPTTVEIALSERSQNQSQGGAEEQIFVVEPEPLSSPSTVEISLPFEAFQDQSEDQYQEDSGSTASSYFFNSNSEQGHDQEPNQESEQGQESESETGHGCELLLEPEIEYENEGEEDEEPIRVNNAPTELLDVYVCGLNTDGQLGLGHSNNNTKQPTQNPYLSKKKAGVVQVAAGGAHCVALTHDNRILTWGANYDGQLGRRTRNLEDDEYPLAQSARPNRDETVPIEVDFSKADLPDDTVFTQVVATDSATFVLTEFGDVYGWGTFRDNRSKLKEKSEERTDKDDSDDEGYDDEDSREPIIGFSSFNGLCQLTPVKIEGLKHITSLAAGAQHVLARHFRGSVYAWGAASRGQLGRKKLNRAGCAHPHLIPRVCNFPGNNIRSGFYGITDIGAGGYHSFAIKKSGEVYSWGWNMHGQTGIPEEELDSSDSFLESETAVSQPTLIPELQGEEAISVTGGMKHSIAVTKDNRCLSWGAIQGNALGIPDKDINTNHVHSSEDGSVDEILGVPGLVTGIEGKVISAAAGARHSLAISGKKMAFGWGSNDKYEIGQQHNKEVDSATVIDGGELKGARVIAAVAGVQFTVLLAE